jgi:hypothetical protein
MLLSQLAALAKSLDATSFVAARPDPVLLAADVRPLDGAASFDTSENALPRTRRFDAASHEDTTEETAYGPQGSPFAGALAEQTPPSGIVRANPDVFPIIKTERNPFRSMITVGRSANNDIVLHGSSVSKVHAYFVRTDFRWWIHDQPSTNGTYVDEARVPESGFPLADGARIAFGPRHAFRFYTARGLHYLITGRR